MVDWDAMKLEYITTNTSYRCLGEKYGISYKKIGERGKKEDWVGEKKIWKAKTAEKALTKAADEEVKRLDALRKSADSLAEIIQDIAVEKDSFIYNGQISPRSIQAAVTALKDLTVVVRNLYELPTQGEKEVQALARERLALEKERLALEKARAGDHGGDADTGVVEIGSVLSREDDG